MVQEFEQFAPPLPDADPFSREFMRPFAESDENALQGVTACFRFAIDITIAGLEA